MIHNLIENHKSVLDIAKIVSKKIHCNIEIKKNTSDPRSYRLDSSKLLKIGFKPKKNLTNAIEELKNLYFKKILKDKPSYHSVNWLKNKLIKKNKIKL